MDCGAIAVGDKGGGAGLLDRRAARGDSGETEIAAGRSFPLASDGRALWRVFARMLLKAVQQILSTPCEPATRL